MKKGKDLSWSLSSLLLLVKNFKKEASDEASLSFLNSLKMEKYVIVGNFFNIIELIGLSNPSRFTKTILGRLLRLGRLGSEEEGERFVDVFSF